MIFWFPLSGTCLSSRSSTSAVVSWWTGCRIISRVKLCTISWTSTCTPTPFTSVGMERPITTRKVALGGTLNCQAEGDRYPKYAIRHYWNMLCFKNTRIPCYPWSTYLITVTLQADVSKFTLTCLLSVSLQWLWRVLLRNINCQTWRFGPASWDAPSRQPRSWGFPTSSGRSWTRSMLYVRRCTTEQTGEGVSSVILFFRVCVKKWPTRWLRKHTQRSLPWEIWTSTITDTLGGR